MAVQPNEMEMIIMLLQSRDIGVLQICHQYRALWPQSIAILAGFEGREGYLLRLKWPDHHNYIYTSSVKGLRTLDIRADVYDLHNSNARHESDLSLIAAWIASQKGVNPALIQTDRQQRKAVGRLSDEYFFDLLINNQAIEYERTCKSATAFADKLNGLLRKCENIVWVIPSNRQDIYNRIRTAYALFTKTWRANNFDFPANSCCS